MTKALSKLVDKRAELEAAHERARVKMETELAIMEELEVDDGEYFKFHHIVIQQGPAWVGYKITGDYDKQGNATAAVRELLAAYKDSIVPYVDYKGTFRGRKPDELFQPDKDGEIIGRGRVVLTVEARAHVNISASQSARVSFWARLKSGRLVYIYIDIEQGTWARYAYPMALYVTFKRDREDKHGVWSYTAPRLPFRSVSYNTGADKPGTGAHVVYMLEHEGDYNTLLDILTA